MLTSPQVKYYFVGFPETGIVKEKIQDIIDFPNAVEGEKIDYTFEDFNQNNHEGFDNIKYENNPYIKFVFNQNIIYESQQANIPLPNNFAVVDNIKVKAITASISLDDETGEVEEQIPIKFYKKDGNSFVLEDGIPAVSFTFNTFIAAVFADSLSSYNCAMSKAMQRAKNTAQVYKGKYELISRKEKEIQFVLKGQKLKGRYVLIYTPWKRGNEWLIFKTKDS